MHDIDFLRDLIVILGAAIIVVTLLRWLHVPSIAGFILTGALVGPTALRLVKDTHQVEVLAELGVVLLLFGIGLELSLDRLKRLWKAIVLGGSVQVLVTLVAVSSGARLFAVPWPQAVFLGCVIAVSSTAVVLRGLSARGEVSAPHGKLAVGILVFQDLCVVPMMLVLPFLSGQGGSVVDMLATTGLALAIVAGVLVAGLKVVPYVLGWVAQTRERDLFLLTVFLICFGIAWLLTLADVSLALGAFLAGLVVAGSEFRHQALSDVIPTREVFTSVFFVSVGMLLNTGELLEDVPLIFALLGAILLGKFLIILGTALVLRANLRVAILTAAALSQVGEFSFVLLRSGSELELIGHQLSQSLLAAIILSMVITPLIFEAAPHLALGASRLPRLYALFGERTAEVPEKAPPQRWVLVAGYGMAGRAVCRLLQELTVPYLAVDMNPENARTARQAGDPIAVGDVTQHELLEELGVRTAMLAVLCVNDIRATERTTRMLHHLKPSLPILARGQYYTDEALLRAAGATEAVSAEGTAAEAIVRKTRHLLEPQHDEKPPRATV